MASALRPASSGNTPLGGGGSSCGPCSCSCTQTLAQLQTLIQNTIASMGATLRWYHNPADISAIVAPVNHAGVPLDERDIDGNPYNVGLFEFHSGATDVVDGYSVLNGDGGRWIKRF